jgi:hypothetical protein
MKQTGPRSTPPRLVGAPRSAKEASSTGSCSSTGVRTSNTVRPCWVFTGGQGRKICEHGEASLNGPQPLARLSSENLTHMQMSLDAWPSVSVCARSRGHMFVTSVCLCWAYGYVQLHNLV